jgi:hypothetical protein
LRDASFRETPGTQFQILQYGEKREAWRTHEEGGDQIFASNVSEHVGCIETKVTHHIQTDPEGIIDDPQLGIKLIVLT